MKNEAVKDLAMSLYLLIKYWNLILPINLLVTLKLESKIQKYSKNTKRFADFKILSIFILAKSLTIVSFISVVPASDGGPSEREKCPLGRESVITARLSFQSSWMEARV